VLLTAYVGGTRNPDLADADPSTLTARVQDDFRTLLGVRGEPTFRAHQLWSKAIPQYSLSHGRFKEIMDEAERRNPGLGLAGSFRDGVALGDVIGAAGETADRVAAQVAS
jgi:oxygen-dependent protoporphyrinogen oxidase